MRQHIIMAMICLLTGVITVPVFAAPSEINPWPPDFDAVARVRVHSIEHALTASDARRVEHGAVPPMVPYKVRLDVLEIYPAVGCRRLLLESIVPTIWMPAKDDTAIIAISGKDKEFFPAGAFPIQGYLPEVNQGNTSLVHFPFPSSPLIQRKLVWECLCNILDAAGVSTAGADTGKWNRRLVEADPAEALVALFYFLHSPGIPATWNAVLDRLSDESPKALPLVDTMVLLSEAIPPEQIVPLIDRVEGRLGKLVCREAPDALAAAAITLVMRMPIEQQAELLERVMRLKCTDPQTQGSLFQNMKQVTDFFSDGKAAGHLPFFEGLLVKPGRYPFVRTGQDIETLWRFLAQAESPALKESLVDFQKHPTGEFLQVNLPPGEIKGLLDTASLLSNPE